MRYLVFGTGAVGGLIGARLALAGDEVTFLARPNVVQALNQHGLKLNAGGQSRQITNLTATSEINTALSSALPDLIVLCVKSYDCAASARTLQQALPEPVPVLSMLNGINNEATLSAALGAEHVIPATLTTAVQMPEPGIVEVARQRGVGIAGDHPLAPRVLSSFSRAGFRVEHYPDPERMKWSKLMTNIVSNATSAITGLDPGQVFAHPGLAALEIQALRETANVMRRLGFRPQNLPGVSVAILGTAIYLPTPIIRPILGRIVARGRGRKKPSLHFDIGRGKSEVAWLNGAVVDFGARLGLDTPINRALNKTMQLLVDDETLHSSFLGKPEALLAAAHSAPSDNTNL